MTPEQVKIYRNLVTLKDGAQVLLRPMLADDAEALIQLFGAASDEDTRYLRDDIRDPAVVRGWCRSLDYRRVLPLMAMAGERAVGQASLHFGQGPEGHIARVRIFLAKDFRGRGLGLRMVNTLVELARKHNLQILVAEIVTDQAKVIRAFMGLGFKVCCTLEDYFMLRDGETRDVEILMLRLRPPEHEF
ncbi:MAG: GNAT family N-acetyltransferase [Chloroflexi bacterium]|nr:GNAT family N-acetyltransferase [Chloroflexota bacterium]